MLMLTRAKKRTPVEYFLGQSESGAYFACSRIRKAAIGGEHDSGNQLAKTIAVLASIGVEIFRDTAFAVTKSGAAFVFKQAMIGDHLNPRRNESDAAAACSGDHICLNALLEEFGIEEN